MREKVASRVQFHVRTTGSVTDGTHEAPDPQREEPVMREQLQGALRATTRFAAVLLLLAVSACGGGGDGYGGGAPPPAAPAGLTYTSPVTTNVGSAMTVLNPTVTGTVTSYAVSPALPAGLALSATSGAVSGTP